MCGAAFETGCLWNWLLNSSTTTATIRTRIHIITITNTCMILFALAVTATCCCCCCFFSYTHVIRGQDNSEAALLDSTALRLFKIHQHSALPDRAVGLTAKSGQHFVECFVRPCGVKSRVALEGRPVDHVH